MKIKALNIKVALIKKMICIESMKINLLYY